jgi:broad specificity phosphatase PhoE
MAPARVARVVGGYLRRVTRDPRQLWLVRHGQSLGNVAHDRAARDRAHVLDVAERDMDVPLSDLGRRQASAFGRWMASSVDPRDVPEVVVASPYVRAVQTAELTLEAAGLDLRVHRDERLREREFGVLDLLTREGIAARFPGEAERRRRLGKFYHRPPGGESWVDVALRIRSLRDSFAREHEGRRVLVFTHEVVIVMWRYLLDDLDEHGALALSATHPIPNCSLTRYRADADGCLVLEADAWVAPLEEEHVPVTADPDAPVAPR